MVAHRFSKTWLLAFGVATLIAAGMFGAVKYVSPPDLRRQLEKNRVVEWPLGDRRSPAEITRKWHEEGISPHAQWVASGARRRLEILAALPTLIVLLYVGFLIGSIPRQWCGTVLGETFLFSILAFLVGAWLLPTPLRQWSGYDLAEAVAVYFLVIAPPLFVASLTTFCIREALENRDADIQRGRD
jgi:uncharacterized membrane protein YeaQ/YmgE (transglycosylase-associated protein family)